MVVTEKLYVWTGPLGRIEMAIGQLGDAEFIGMPVPLVQAAMPYFPRAVKWCAEHEVMTDRLEAGKTEVAWVPISEVVGG